MKNYAERDGLELQDCAVEDLIDLIALHAHNDQSLIVTSTVGNSNGLDGAWLDEMLLHGPDGSGLSANWVVQALYVLARHLSMHSGATIIDTIGPAFEQLEVAARARPVWVERNVISFASMRQVVNFYIHHPRADSAREKLSVQPRQSLALALHSLMDPDVPPIGFPRSAPAMTTEIVPAPAPAPSRRTWFDRMRQAITHTHIKGMPK